MEKLLATRRRGPTTTQGIPNDCSVKAVRGARLFHLLRCTPGSRDRGVSVATCRPGACRQWLEERGPAAAPDHEVAPASTHIRTCSVVMAALGIRPQQIPHAGNTGSSEHGQCGPNALTFPPPSPAHQGPPPAAHLPADTAGAPWEPGHHNDPHQPSLSLSF